MISNPDVFIPQNLAELFAVAESNRGRVHFVAGATDWVTQNSKILPQDSVVIDLSALKALRGIEVRGAYLAVGPMETMSAISENAFIWREAACLAEAAQKLGSWQIRNRATVGGNVANSSPAADTPVALTALGATVILRSPEGCRELPADSIAAAPGCSALTRAELITEFRIPIAERRISSFGKIGSRTEVSIARLNMAVSVEFDALGNVSNAAVVIGALGAFPIHAERAEDILIHEGGSNVGGFCDALTESVDRAIPERASLPYKRRAIRALGEDILTELEIKAVKAGFSL